MVAPRAVQLVALSAVLKVDWSVALKAVQLVVPKAVLMVDQLG